MLKDAGLAYLKRKANQMTELVLLLLGRQSLDGSISYSEVGKKL